MTPQDLIAYIEGLIIDNTTQQVSPYKMRSVLIEMVNSLNQSNISSLSAVLPLVYAPFTNTLSLPVVNNLTAGGTNAVLSAEQGKILKQLIDDIVIGVGSQDLQQTLDIYNIADKEIIIRNDSLDKFISVAKGSKDLSMFADKLVHSSNGENATQIIFQETTTPADVLVRNLSGTIALLSDLTAIQEGIAWKQPVELAFDTAVTQSGAIPQLASLTNQGITLINDSRVILMAQANPVYNGIWRVNSTPVSGFYRLYRTDDANTTAELNNAVAGVTGGTHAGKTFRQTAVNPTIGTTAINFVDFGNAVANATNVLAGIAKLYNAIGTETDGGITPNAVKIGFDLKADLTQVGNLIREEFTFSGSQTFTLANNYGQVYSVEVQGQGALSTSQYTLVAPNQITITDTLDSGDYIVVIYSNAIAGIQPYYSQAEVDAFLLLKADSNQTAKTWKSGIDGVTVSNTNTITPTYTQLIPANTFSAGDVVELLFRSTAPGAKTSQTNVYIFINTVANLTGTPIQVGLFNTTATGRTVQLERTLSVKGSTTRVVNSTGPNATDTTQTSGMSTLTIDWTINQHIIFAIGHTVADQTLTGDFYRITKN